MIFFNAKLWQKVESDIFNGERTLIKIVETQYCCYITGTNTKNGLNGTSAYNTFARNTAASIHDSSSLARTRRGHCQSNCTFTTSSFASSEQCAPAADSSWAPSCQQLREQCQQHARQHRRQLSQPLQEPSA